MSRGLLLLLVSLGLAAAAAAAPADASDSDLRFVLILSRHGVRSPLFKEADMAPYVAAPWPHWEVPPGYLTPHGREQMALMGSYYRAYYAAAGLLTGRAEEDASRIFFRADSDQRTIASAEGLAAGLVPGVSPRIHALPEGRPDDPLFHSFAAHVGHPDFDLAAASVRGRIGDNLSMPVEAYRPAFDLLEQVVFGGDGSPPPDKVSILSLRGSIERGKTTDLLQFRWPLAKATQLTDAFVLEYADAKPLTDVGWGRITPAKMTQLLGLTALGFDLGHRTLYPAQVEGSNLAGHILETLERAAWGPPVDGAIGSPADRMIFLVGHDTNIINVSGLLGFGWQVPGAPANVALPGGALVFELRQSRSDGRWVVRIRYVSQTLDQMRDATPLTLDHPPASAPIFIPGCSSASPNFDAPLDLFIAHLRAVIDPAFTAPEPSNEALEGTSPGRP